MSSLVQSLRAMIAAKTQAPRIVPRFVLAAPRSGTTWLNRMLNAHPDVCATETRIWGNYADFVIDGDHPEPRLRVTLDKYVDGLLQFWDWSPGRNTAEYARDVCIEGMVEQLSRTALRLSGKRVLVEKITPYLGTATTVCAGIERLFPGSSIAYLLRDGRDVALSGVFHWLQRVHADVPATPFQKARAAAFAGGGKSSWAESRFFEDKEIEEWARTWVEPIQAFHVGERREGMHIVRYEDMISEVASALRSVLEYFNCSTRDGIVQHCVAAGSFSAMSGGRARGEAVAGAHVRKGVSGDWCNFFTRRDAEIFQHIAGELLLALGYESDPDWCRKCPEALA
jgi:hypothetical protein